MRSKSSAHTKEKESEIVMKNLPYLAQLIGSKKIGTKEKLEVLEDVNTDVAAYLLSIGEEV